MLAAVTFAATAWTAGIESVPTAADTAAIGKKLARIGVHVRPSDRGFTIPSSSDEPTLQCARPAEGCLSATLDRVLARPYGSTTPERGDLVAFWAPARTLADCGASGVFVKRLIGLPGDTWAEKAGYVYIDGKRLDEPYIKPQYRDQATYAPLKIPAGQYFVMGDNRVGSCDSRKWGTVPRRDIIGKLIAIYWPLARVRRL